jgi:hypothetical protein
MEQVFAGGVQFFLIPNLMQGEIGEAVERFAFVIKVYPTARTSVDYEANWGKSMRMSFISPGRVHDLRFRVSVNQMEPKLTDRPVGGFRCTISDSESDSVNRMEPRLPQTRSFSISANIHRWHSIQHGALGASFRSSARSPIQNPTV